MQFGNSKSVIQQIHWKTEHKIVFSLFRKCICWEQQELRRDLGI